MSRRLPLSGLLLVAAAIFFNGWILGGLGHGAAGYLHMSISELAVPSQSWSGLFRSLDGLAGLLFIIGGIGAVIRAWPTMWPLVAVAVLIAALGALTVFDVTHPLDCSRDRSPACVSAIATHQVSRTNDLHEQESRITAYVSIGLAAAVASATLLTKRPRLVVVSAVTLLALITLALDIEDSSGSLVTGAMAERAWNLLVSGDVVLLTSLPGRRDPG